MTKTNPYNHSGYDKDQENVPCRENCGRTVSAERRKNRGRICEECEIHTRNVRKGIEQPRYKSIDVLRIKT